jgi:hypothetical protein
MLAMQNMRLYSMNPLWVSAEVDTVLRTIPPSSYSTPALQIQGNQAPSGTWQRPADPLTPATWSGLEAIWMANHTVAEGGLHNNRWTVTYNGGIAEDSLLGNVIGTGEKTWDSYLVATVIRYNKFTAVSGTAGDIRIKSAISGNVKVGLYDDDGAGGDPSTLLAYGTGAVVAGWNTIQLNIQVALTAGSYWLAVKCDRDSAVSMLAADTATGKISTGVIPYADAMPNPAEIGMSSSVRGIAIAGWGLKVV